MKKIKFLFYRSIYWFQRWRLSQQFDSFLINAVEYREKRQKLIDKQKEFEKKFN